MLKRTKIVATLGPATDREGVLKAILENGVNTVRLNFSHGCAEEHQQRAEEVRKHAQELNLSIAILADLQGPKIRIARFKNDKIKLEAGTDFLLDSELDSTAGDETQVGIDYKELPQDCNVGDVLLLDDGRVQVEVIAINGSQVQTKVLIGGPLSNNKGINRQGGGLSAAALTSKDKADIKVAAAMGVDYVAVSFPRCSEDLQEARALLDTEHSKAAIIAKIERAEITQSSDALDDIILSCDGIMVARGDLGVEIGDAELIGVQKLMIKRARKLKRLVITATQMMETMIENPMPTRAEVFDVANAILDGTDAVMLSAETAAGEHPVEVVTAMTDICQGAEKHQHNINSSGGVNDISERFDETIARAAMYTANFLEGATAVICLTESGSTPLWMSRTRSLLPIYALSRNHNTLRKMALYRGVEPIFFDPTNANEPDLNNIILSSLKDQGFVAAGDQVILTRGTTLGVDGGTNSMQLLYVS